MPNPPPTPSPLPQWRRYLDAVPGGIDAYPECLVKSSVIRAVLESVPERVQVDVEALPARAAELVRNPPLPNAWTSEVVFHVIMLACQEGLPKNELDQWVFERNRKLLGTSLYRVLFLLVSPERLFVGFAKRWGAFRRGTELAIVELTNSSVHFIIAFPVRLHNAATLRNAVIAMCAAGEAAGATNPIGKVERITDTSAEILIEWQ